jgi:hypothetical protein
MLITNSFLAIEDIINAENDYFQFKDRVDMWMGKQ